MSHKTYTINGKTYLQRPLVIGQLANLLKELNGVEFSSGDAMELIAAFGSRLPRILACVLIPDGKTPSDIDINTLSEEIGAAMDIDTASEVLADFFAVTRLQSSFSRLATMMREQIGKMAQTGQASSAPSSPEATQ